MDIKIQFKLNKSDYLDLLGASDMPNVGKVVILPCDVEVINLTASGKNMSEETLYTIIIPAISGVATGIIANYLYAKLSEKIKSISINGREVEIHKEKIVHTIKNIETIKISETGDLDITKEVTEIKEYLLHKSKGDTNE